MTRIPGWRDELPDLDREKVKEFVERNRKDLSERDAMHKGKESWSHGRRELVREIIGEITSGAWDSTRPSKARILARLRYIEADKRYEPDPAKRANVVINAPLTLIQLELETEHRILVEFLGESL